MDIKTSVAAQGYARARSAATPLSESTVSDQGGGLGKVGQPQRGRFLVARARRIHVALGHLGQCPARNVG